jgi:hypothetical protein
VRTLSRKRPPGDASKHEEYRRAVRDLEHAHRFFQQLHGLGKASGLDARKLQQHINFIADTHTKSLVGGASVVAGWRQGGHRWPQQTKLTCCLFGRRCRAVAVGRQPASRRLAAGSGQRRAGGGGRPGVAMHPWHDPNGISKP